MNSDMAKRGGAPVGVIEDLPSLEAGAVIYLRLWCDGPDAQAQVWNDFRVALGNTQGRKALSAFEQLLNLCAVHGRRPMMRHSVSCRCIGSDESCFANFVAAAAEGDREDAILLASLLARPELAPAMTALAADFGLAIKRMFLRCTMSHRTQHRAPSTLQ